MSQNSVSPVPPAPPPPPPPRYDTIPRPTFTQLRASDLLTRRQNESPTGAAVTSTYTTQGRLLPPPPPAVVTPTQNNRTTGIAPTLLTVVPPASTYPNHTVIGSSASFLPLAPNFQNGPGTTAAIIPLTPNYLLTGTSATLPPSLPHYNSVAPTAAIPVPRENNQNETPIVTTLVATPTAEQNNTTTPPVVTVQPDTKSMDSKSVDIPYPQNQRGWTTGLFNCFSDCSVCLVGMCCYPCLGWQIATSLGEATCTACCCGGLVPLRTKLRSILGISGTIENDCCVICWCPECAICQMQRELKRRGMA